MQPEDSYFPKNSNFLAGLTNSAGEFMRLHEQAIRTLAFFEAIKCNLDEHDQTPRRGLLAQLTSNSVSFIRDSDISNQANVLKYAGAVVSTTPPYEFYKDEESGVSFASFFVHYDVPPSSIAQSPVTLLCLTPREELQDAPRQPAITAAELECAVPAFIIPSGSGADSLQLFRYNIEKVEGSQQCHFSLLSPVDTENFLDNDAQRFVDAMSQSSE